MGDWETKRLLEIARRVNERTFSHVDGRDLLAQLHPRRQIDIKRRVDGVETWFEGDWLSGLYDEIKALRAFLAASGERIQRPMQAQIASGQIGGDLVKSTQPMTAASEVSRETRREAGLSPRTEDTPNIIPGTTVKGETL